MVIFQLNVRLAEGGAAGVALDLHRRAIAQNIFSTFIYGYGKKGLKSKSHNIYDNVIKNTNIITSYLNLLTHPFLNYDPFGSINHLEKELNKINGDEKIIIHLHVIHSYWLNYHHLVKVFTKLKSLKNISLVWTLHDHWAITGRCAFLENCENWRNKCYKCPSLTNYPPVKIDKAVNEFHNKIAFVKQMSELGCKFISPSVHVAKAFNSQYSNMGVSQCIVVNNGIDIDSENYITNLLSLKSNVQNKDQIESRPRFAVVAHDLSYDGKTNIELIKTLLNADLEIHTFGKNSLFSDVKVHNHGYISSKTILLEAISKLDGLIFTSKVDNYPLILCECLSLGVPVLATASDASIEVLKKVGGKTIQENEFTYYTGLTKDKICQLLYNKSTKQLQKDALNAFGGNKMLAEYS
ncbi:TPA: hypothetical protein ACJCGT_005609, partial [Klebsiella pneumoniae]